MVKLARFFFFVLNVFFLLYSSPAYAVQEINSKTEITSDTVWQGDILLKGDVRINRGATLIILPGTNIRFKKIKDFGPDKLSLDKANHFPRAELIVRGRLIAQGLRDKMITFTSAEKRPSVSDWGAINFIGSRDNILEFCSISYGHTSIHCHSAQVLVSRCRLHDNGVAIGMKNIRGMDIKCAVPVVYNRIWQNGGGILIGGSANSVISHNQITENKFFGIFTKKSGPCCIRFNNIFKNAKGIILYSVPRLILRENNIFDNLDYNISLLEGQEQDVDARYNWWGSTDLKKIRNSIKDESSDKGLGRVRICDFANEPVSGAGRF